MEGFLQNNELTYERNSYYAKNTFLHAKVDMSKPVTYDEVRDKLPQPIFDGHDSYLACYDYAWQVAFSNLSRPVEGSGFVSPFIDTAFNGCLFMWDSTFIMMFTRYAEHLWPFQKTLDNFYALQHRDGFICREIIEANGQDRFTRHDPAATGPNIMAWSELEYYENFGDIDRLRRVYAPLRAYHIWLRRNHTWRDGSYYSSGWGCGMDNQPRVQPGRNVSHSNAHMVWIDSTLQALLDARCLVHMAKELGHEEDIPALQEEIELLLKIVNERLWSEKDAFYYDEWRDGTLSGVKSVASYWALLAEAVPEERMERFVAHLDNENEFKRPNRVPTLSADNSEYDKQGGYWRGAIWAPTNYMILRGLEKTGYDAMAHEIALACVDHTTQVFNETDTLWENYAPEFPYPGVRDGDWMCTKDFVGWSGLFPISILYEYIMGIKSDPVHHKLRWDVRLTDAHGIVDYPFGDTPITLRCEERAAATDEPVITVEASCPIEVEVLWEGGSKVITLNK